MSSSVDSSGNVVDNESSSTHTASGSASRLSDDPSYDWVDPVVLKIPTRLTDSDKLDVLLPENSFLALHCPSGAIMADICGVTDRVCHDWENAPVDFFFVYSTLFVDLHVNLPFDDFTMGVLETLNVAPTQLHPNSWAALQVFRVLCRLFKLEPTPKAFFYIITIHVQALL